MAKPDWISFSESSGEGSGSFSILVDKNDSTSARSGVVTIKTISGLTHEIQVTQAGKVANSFQGSGKFCSIGIEASTFPSGVNQVTFCASIILSGNTQQISAGTLTLTKDESTGMSFGDLSLDSEKISVDSGVYVGRILVTCNPGNIPWSTPFNRFTGSLEYDPGNIAFGTSTSSTSYSASFQQPFGYAWGFYIPEKIPISGETTLVYKTPSNLPAILITEVR
jgi:hypothetical protein|nr:MAG TPA: Putative binding domain, N-terminal [Crassvirales sp.]